MDITIKIIPNETGNPAAKLADAEIVFGADAGPFAGLRLVGFGVWESRIGSHTRGVTFPARTYTVRGERRTYCLLRPQGEESVTDASTEALKNAILDAYAAHQRDIEPETDPAPVSAPRPAYGPPSNVTSIDTITDYGATQRLSRAISMF